MQPSGIEVKAERVQSLGPIHLCINLKLSGTKPYKRFLFRSCLLDAMTSMLNAALLFSLFLWAAPSWPAAAGSL
jgi:hypothetical protein